MNTHHSAEPIVFKFASFELIPAMRLLAKDGRALKVGSRALDLLIALIERAGQIVTKDELMAMVWSDVIVEDTNLRVHISSLRRLLGDDGADSRYIVHVARRGYMFVSPSLSQCRIELQRGPIVTAPISGNPIFTRQYAVEPEYSG